MELLGSLNLKRILHQRGKNDSRINNMIAF